MANSEQPTTKVPAELLDLFHNRRWHTHYDEKTMPHWVYTTEGENGKTGDAVLIGRQRTDPNGDWGLTLKPLQYVAEAVRDGRVLRGWVVLAGPPLPADPNTIVAWARIQDVVALRSNARMFDGRWGEYFWVDTSFRPTQTASNQYSNKEDLPF